MPYIWTTISIWHENMLGNLLADIICSSRLSCFAEQLMSKEKYQSIKIIFAPNEGYCVYYPSNIFCNVHCFQNWGISLGYSPVSAGTVVTHLEKSCMSENIWWTIKAVNYPTLHLFLLYFISGDEPDYSTYRNRRGPCSGSVCDREEECYPKQCGASICYECKEVKVCNQINC